MHITGLTVCVGYAELLAKSLQMWRDGFDRLVVVTSREDKETITLCDLMQVSHYSTEVFFDNGAKFNKGAAIAEAYAWLQFGFLPREWMLFFDADIEPPSRWRELIYSGVANGEIQSGNLYGAKRVEESGKPINDPDLAGYFHLAHVQDANMQVEPIVDKHWYHAGNYDSTFQNRWQKTQRQWIRGLTVIHRGEPGANWCGVGKRDEVVKLHEERRKRGWKWDHETVEQNR